MVIEGSAFILGENGNFCCQVLTHTLLHRLYYAHTVHHTVLHCLCKAPANTSTHATLALFTPSLFHFLFVSPSFSKTQRRNLHLGHRNADKKNIVLCSYIALLAVFNK